MKLKEINLYFGLMLFIGFLVTGYYMKTYFKPEFLDNHVIRMQIRANHIYILFISLLNVISYTSQIKRKYLELTFRLCLIVAGILAVVAFLVEHSGNLNDRSWTLFSVILSVVAIGFILFNELLNVINKKRENMQQ
ncbi:MAG: hypothetical protein ACWA5P_07590 [bacterium]